MCRLPTTVTSMAKLARNEQVKVATLPSGQCIDAPQARSTPASFLAASGSAATLSGQLVADGPQDGADAVPPDVTERAEGVQVRLHPDVVLEEIVVRVIARKLTTLCICRESKGKY